MGYTTRIPKPTLLIVGANQLPTPQLLPTLRQKHRLVLLDPADAGNSDDLHVSKLSQIDDNLDIDGCIFFSEVRPFSRRWTERNQKHLLSQQRKEILELMGFFENRTTAPSFILMDSSTNLYGLRKHKRIFECATTQPIFISRFYQQAEALAQARARKLGSRLVPLRMGQVLSASGGIASQPFQIFGDNTQWLPWIHERDFVSLVSFVIDNPRVHQAVNVCSAHPETLEYFGQELRASRPKRWSLKLPQVLISNFVGSRGRLLWNGQRALPGEALKHGFVFEYKKLPEALHALARDAESLATRVEIDTQVTSKKAAAES
ncbi:MAG: DUF1731 domain-containing protein [Pseudomonadota bacterium]